MRRQSGSRPCQVAGRRCECSQIVTFRAPDHNQALDLAQADQGTRRWHRGTIYKAHETVRFLIEHKAPVDALDGKGRIPLALAVRACVDSYWTSRRSPESVEALLRAGPPTSGALFPSGYAEVDELLRLKNEAAP
jgi:hypothetical protein